MRRVLALFLALFAGRASAMPVERTLNLSVGDLHFEKNRFAFETEVVPKDLATAELLPAGEILVTPLKEGDGLLLLYKRGEVVGVRLHVNRPGSTAPLDLREAKKACGAAEAREENGETYLSVSVNDEPCRAAVKRALEGDAVPADHLQLSFTVPGLQAQLKALAARVAEAGLTGIDLGYSGVTLRLKGTTDPASHLKLLGILWREALGHLDLDDQIEHPHAL